MKNIQKIVHHSEVSEKMIEKYLVSEVAKLGGLCLKYANSNMTGYPDRLVLLPHGGLMWVELKSKGKKPTPLQALRHQQLAKLGFPVTVVDSREGVDELINAWRTLV